MSSEEVAKSAFNKGRFRHFLKEIIGPRRLRPAEGNGRTQAVSSPSASPDWRQPIPSAVDMKLIERILIHRVIRASLFAGGVVPYFSA